MKTKDRLTSARARFVITVIALILVLPTILASAQELDSEKPKREARASTWGFFVAPYGWLTGVEGTVVTDGEAVGIKIPFEDFAENTTSGLQLYFEARRNRFFVGFDGTWATLGGTMDGRLFDLDIEIRQRIYDIRIGYEVYDREIGDLIEKRKFDWQRRGIVDLFVGGRYFRTEPVVELTPVVGDPRSISSVDSRIDPFLGLRVAWDMSYRWGIGFRGDIGGFGIGNAAQFSWQAATQLGFRLSRHWVLFGGYRVLEYDTVSGSGEERNGTDLRQQGPVIGGGYSF